MESTNDGLIDGLKSRIRELDQRSLELKRAVNALNKERGEPPSYQSSDLVVSEAGGSLAVKPDQFYSLKIHTAMRQYLAMRKTAGLGPATLNEIYGALCNGGLKFETEIEENRKTNLRFLLRKNTSIFHRLPDKVHFGLAEWYPGAKDLDQDYEAQKPKKKSKPKARVFAKSNDNKESDKAPLTGKNSTNRDVPPKAVAQPKVTQETAVREAIDAIKGDFRKAEIVEWVDKKYPALKAKEKKDSINAMLAKLTDLVEVVKQGGGAEPSIFRKKVAVAIK